MLRKCNLSKTQNGFSSLEGISSQVELKAPTQFFINLTAFPTYFPLNQKAHEKWGEEYGTEKDKMLFCGPFVISEWTHKSKLVLKKNPNYWDAANVKLDEIRFDVIKDINTPVTMFKAKQLDAIGIPGDFIPEFQQNGQLKQLPEAVAWYLECNLNDPLLKNQAFRHALSLAIDRKAYVDGVLKDFSKPATSLTPPSIHGPDGKSFAENLKGDPNLLSETANVDQARTLLKQVCKELGYAVPKLPQ